MDLVVIKTMDGDVYINPTQVQWFWDWQGKLAIRFSGDREMQTFEDTTAENFAKALLNTRR